MLFLFSFTLHDVLISSFSDTIIFFSMCLYLVMTCIILLIQGIYSFAYHNHWAWPIMEDFELIDLGLEDWIREFKTMTHLSYVHSSTLSLPHLNLLDMGLSIVSVVQYHPLAPLHDLYIPTYFSFVQHHYLFFLSFFDPTKQSLRRLNLRCVLHDEKYLMINELVAW